MRVLLSSLLLTQFLFALEIFSNLAKENGSEFEIIHIKDKTPFKCKKIRKNVDISYYLCKINRDINYTENKKTLRFSILSLKKNLNSFEIRIFPTHNSKLIAIHTDLTENKTVFDKKIKKAKHWQIIAYKKEPPYLKENDKKGINFPITYENLLRPFVGALDIDKKPITYDNKKDIKPYNVLKKLYDEKEYEEVIKEADYIYEKYPDSLFMSEILLLKMRAIDKFLSLQNSKDFKIKVSYTDLAELAKEWIRRFPSDRNLPEVLMFLSKAYLHTGLKKNALYYLNVLTTEHKNNKFTELGKIYLADTYAESKPKKALKLYKEIYYNTKHIYVASVAADRIAWLLFRLAKYKEAEKYFLKILKANPDFYLEDKVRAYDLAQKLAANNMYKIAAIIAEKLVERIKKKKKYNFYEELIKNRAYWFDKAKDTKKAYKYYKEYQKMYPFGEFSDFVKERLDLLVLVKPDENATKTLKEYNYIISHYQDPEILHKAYFEKAKLLFRLKRYDEILNMEKKLLKIENKKKEIKKLIKDTALNLSIISLENGKCEKTDYLIEKYKLKLPKRLDEKLFKCYMKLSKYDKAFSIFRRHRFDEDLNSKLKWLYMGAKLYQKTGEDEKVIETYQDIKSLSQILKKPIKRWARDLYFNALYNLKKYEEAIKEALLIEKLYPNDFKNSDIFYKVVRMALEKEDDLTALNFAKRVVNLQNSYNLYPYSPSIDFIYIESLKKAGKNKEAFEFANNLLKRVKNDKEKARVLYLIGELAIKLNKTDKAKEAFKKCSDLNTSSSWKDLCKDNLSLY